ncbi:FIG01146407: hypothetical protein [hydrothermal vent metagenome]|uniref:Uncharacterized protein n=1 Tax=hydrothermal vent metagenome TaxID=652676 RepID=A0A1W1EJ18_9ZZZZ
MKKIVILSIIIGVTQANEFDDILSTNNQKIIKYQKKQNQLNSDKLEKSWINPITISYSKNYSHQFKNSRVDTGSFSIGINQPIFKSGGIYFAMKYANIVHKLGDTNIDIAKKSMIINALSTLYNISKAKLQKAKLSLLIKNDNIDIKQKEDKYNSGLIDSSFLDQAIIKKNSDELALLELDLKIVKLQNAFSLLSDKNPNSIKLPKLKLIKASRYKGKNLELIKKKFEAQEKKYSSKLIWTQYLPTISVEARYNDSDPSPFFNSPNIKEAYYTYGFRISMPISINSLKDIEASKVAYMEAQTKLIEKRIEIDNEYKLAITNLNILKKKIALTKKDEKLYRRLYNSTKNLQKAGEKTKFDTELMLNSLNIKKYDKKIYQLDIELQLLSLYSKVI